MIVSQAAGSTPDIVARLVTEPMSAILGQSFVIDNRPGVGNMVGAQAAAHAPADGYTVFFATAAALVTNEYTYKSLPYQPQRDFTPVAFVGKAPFVLLAHPSVQARSLADLMALDHAAPGTLAIANDGPRNASGIVAAWLNKAAHLQLQPVAYATMPQGIQDTLAGRTQLVILAPPSALPFTRKGQLRPLGVTSAHPVPGLEGVPPIAETVPGFNLVGWFVIVAPAQAPAEAVQALNRAAARVLGDAALIARLHELGVYPEPARSPEEVRAFIGQERALWGSILQQIGITPE
jgi:tripartite-type tricarboxylate transporter receptor subunit TctC